MSVISKLTDTIRFSPNSNKIIDLIKSAEKESSVDIIEQIELITGVWELKWSSSRDPFLSYSPLIDNLQILDPVKGRALNLLRAKNCIGNFGSFNIYANIDILDRKRINVSFNKAGIKGPELLGKNIDFIFEIKKSQKGWLDTSVLTSDLRICRGYKGTTFALLKRHDLSLTNFFNI